MDSLSPKERSENMRRIRSRNTSPEKKVKYLLQSLRFKFRSHVRNLPGRPDFVFEKRRKALFVHGCFWHFHRRCNIGRIPKSRLEYWIPKLIRNKQRDAVTRRRLRQAGWMVFTIWECQLQDFVGARRRIKEFLGAR